MKKIIALFASLLFGCVTAHASDAASTQSSETGKIIAAQLVEITQLQKQMLLLMQKKHAAESSQTCIHNDHAYTRGAVIDMAGVLKTFAPRLPIINEAIHLVWTESGADEKTTAVPMR